MRPVTLAATTLAMLAFATAAYADSNYGPRHNGNQCWHHQNGNSLGYLGSLPAFEERPGRLHHDPGQRE
jgi:hypothetical protein